MKRLLLLAICGLFPSFLIAIDVKEAPIGDVRNVDEYTPCISISSYTWTLVPSSTDGNWRRRQGIMFKENSTNSANVNVIMSTHTATPTVSTQTAHIELKPADNFVSIQAGDGIYFWLHSRSTYTAENVCFGEWKQ